MMLKTIFNQTSVEYCKVYTEKQNECNFFLIAVRLASLNQILDPWVYLLLRKILLQKFCQVANAVCSCSKNGQKVQTISLSHEITQTEAWKRTLNLHVHSFWQQIALNLTVNLGISGMPLFMHWSWIFDVSLHGLRSIDNPLCAQITETQRKIHL